VIELEYEIEPGPAVSLLDGVATRSRDMRPAMVQIRELLIQGNKQNFESRGSLFGERWAPLKESTLERKAQQGLPVDPMIATRTLLTAIEGGKGKKTSATRTMASVGVSRDIFWVNFAMKGRHRSGSGGKGGYEPARPVLGMTEGERREAVTIMERYLMYGIG
jgi:morphogenesis family protein